MAWLLIYKTSAGPPNIYRRYVQVNHSPRSIEVSFTVPDRRRRILPEVVLVRRWVIGVPGIWRGRVKGRVGTGEVSLQAT